MELRDYLRILRDHWIVIALCAIVGVAGAYVWVSMQPRVYTADANGYVVAESDQEGTGASLVNNSLALSKVQSYVRLGGLRSVAEHAIEDLGLSVSPESLVSRVSVSNPTDTVIIEVRATGPTPESARDLASAWVRGMQVEIEKLETPSNGGEAYMRLSPADSARLPTSPTSPNVKMTVALGGLVGLAAGLGWALLRHTLDRRIRCGEVIRKETGLAVVGVIPEEKTVIASHGVMPVGERAAAQGRERHSLLGYGEAMRELRTNLQFMDVDSPPRSIVVTSSLPEEGKSTTSANLAITIAANGQRVVLVEGDLRKPVIAELFGITSEPGLTDVLAGRVCPGDVTHAVGHSRNLFVIPAGRFAPNPSEILGSQRMRELIDDLARDYFVIIDAPPLIPVTDAAVLAHHADGALLLVKSGRTSIDALAMANEKLEGAGGRVLGVVLNRAPRSGSSSSYYGYRYAGEQHLHATMDS